MAFRSALITGASSGIGEAFARGLPRFPMTGSAAPRSQRPRAPRSIW